MNHSTLFSDRLAFILPQCFRKIQRIDRINPFYHPVGDFNLPDEIYHLPDGQRKYVRTCFQMWERRDYKRKKFGTTSYNEFFTQVPKDEAEYYLRTQGSTAGKILEGFDYKGTTGRFMRGSKERILAHDWTKIARMASGAPSIGLHDIAWGFRSSNIDEYLIHGIMYDLINGHYNDKPGGVLPI